MFICLWQGTATTALVRSAMWALSKGWDLSPLKMPISNGARIYSFPELRKGKNETTDTFKGLPAMLSDSLPDTYGNQLINVWLAQQGRPDNSMNPVEQLCFIGTRGMGALEFETALFKDGKRAATLEMRSLVDIAQRMLNQRESFQTNLHKDEEKAVGEILKIGTSAGGARPKALIAYNPRTLKNFITNNTGQKALISRLNTLISIIEELS
jgi:serine/threonine-protein kinase HipA